MSAARAVALIALLVEACRDASTPVPSGPRNDATRVPGQYIVVFQDTVADPAGLAQSLVQAQGGMLLHTYTSALKGFAARLPDAAVAALGQNPRVAYVEPDQQGSVSGTQLPAGTPSPARGASAAAVPRQNPPVAFAASAQPTTQQMDAQGNPWGLDRIDQRTLPFSGTYTYTSTGAGVHVYIIDTGIWTAHPEFQGRADNVFDFAGGTGTDCFGSGTAVAGVVGSATYGVAKGVSLHGVRVYDCTGAGLRSDLVAGVDWVSAHHASPAVANISVSLNPSTALTTAVKNLWNSGVFVVTTAANHDDDACLEAGGASGAFTVTASTAYDTKAGFSNWGPCVQIYAPGEYIQSTWLGGQTNIVSGTSYAAPFVTGVAATYKAAVGDASSDAVASWILNNATAGVITGNHAGTPNLLLYSAAAPVPAPVANFTVSCSGLTCSFDASSSTAQTTATYDWTWGDATPAGAGKTATHTYAAAGTHSVTLTVTDAGGSNSTTRPVSTAPVANFTFSCAGLACSFDASSSTAQTTATYGWTWGDATTGSGKTATHTYTGGGTYTVTLTVIDAGGSGANTQPVTVTAPPPPPVANFTFSCSGLTCSFDASSSTAQATATYSWTWGEAATGTGMTATHTYATAGTYSVTLTVTDAGGRNSQTRTVTVVAPPVANFTFSCAGLACSFDASSSTAQATASYGWTWGDGTTGAGKTPEHTYATGGSYSVTLTVTDAGGSSSISKTVTVNRPPTVNAGPDETAVTGLLYTLSATFSDPDNDGPWSYTIYWGDGSTTIGSTSSQGTITAGHTYVVIVPRNFTITVRVTDSHGASGSGSKVVTVLLL